VFDDASIARLRRILKLRPAIQIDAPEYRRACVLVPLIRHEGKWSVLFTRRAENMAAHSGQIAFPGGGMEEGETLEEAAIREAEEEVGIRAAGVELIGRLDDLITNSGYLVAPFVGVIQKPEQYEMQEGEVVEVFEVPLDALLDPAQPEVRYVRFQNRRYPAYYYIHDQYEIWGLTGRMLKGFLDLAWQTV